MACRYGSTIIFCFMSAIAGYLFAALVMAKRWRRSRVLTPVQFLNERYNRTTNRVYSWFLSVMLFLSGAIGLNALCKFFSV